MDQQPATSNQRLAVALVPIPVRMRLAATPCVALLSALAGCGGNVNLFGIYFAPWMACMAGGTVLAYAATRLLERHLFDYDPRYFAWAFLALTILFSVGFWAAFAPG